MSTQRKTRSNKAQNLADWKVQVTKRRSRIKVDARKYKARVLEILNLLSASKRMHPIDPPANARQLSIVLTNDREIQDLNKAFRGKDKPTDVLSFSQLEGEGLEHAQSLGDLVISLDRVSAQAKAYKVTWEAELLRLTIHGILHLFGYDHEKVSAAQARRMRRKEREVFKNIAR